MWKPLRGLHIELQHSAAFCILRQKSLTPVSTHFLCQESIPGDYLREATCVTLGIMLNLDATQQNAERSKLATAPYEVSIMLNSHAAVAAAEVTIECHVRTFVASRIYFHPSSVASYLHHIGRHDFDAAHDFCRKNARRKKKLKFHMNLPLFWTPRQNDTMWSWGILSDPLWEEMVKFLVFWNDLRNKSEFLSEASVQVEMNSVESWYKSRRFILGVATCLEQWVSAEHKEKRAVLNTVVWCVLTWAFSTTCTVMHWVLTSKYKSTSVVFVSLLYEQEKVQMKLLASSSRQGLHAKENENSTPSCLTSQRNFWNSYVVLCLGQKWENISLFCSEKFICANFSCSNVCWVILVNFEARTKEYWTVFLRPILALFSGKFWSDSSKTRGVVPKVAFAFMFGCTVRCQGCGLCAKAALW